MALHARTRTGRGQVVDSAIYEAVLAVMENLVTEYDKTGYIRERTGAILPNIAPSNVYPTKSGVYVLIAANQDSVFRRLAAAMGRPELATDPHYATHTERGKRQAELDALIAAWTAGFEREELGRILDEAGVPRGDIYRAPRCWRTPTSRRARPSSTWRIRCSAPSRCRTWRRASRSIRAGWSLPGRNSASTMPRFSAGSSA